MKTMMMMMMMVMLVIMMVVVVVLVMICVVVVLVMTVNTSRIYRVRGTPSYVLASLPESTPRPAWGAVSAA